MKAGKPAEAVPKFIASLAAEPSAVAALNLADSYERIGKVASAHERFVQAEALSSANGDALRAAEARKRAEMLVPRLSTITVLPPPSGVRASVWIDGTPLPAEAWGKPRPFDPGPHEVVLQTERGRRHAQVVKLEGEGTNATVPWQVEDDRADEKSPSGDAPKLASKGDDEGGSGMRTAALVTGGVGIAALVAGGITGIVALGAKSDLEDACATYPRCPSSRQSELDDIDGRGRAMATASTISFAAGAALLATGIIFWIVSTPRSAEHAADKAGAARIVPGGFVF